MKVILASAGLVLATLSGTALSHPGPAHTGLHLLEHAVLLALVLLPVGLALMPLWRQHRRRADRSQ